MSLSDSDCWGVNRTRDGTFSNNLGTIKSREASSTF